MADKVRPFAVPFKHGRMCRSLISNQFGLFASGDDNGQVIVFDEAGRLVTSFETAPPQVREGSFFPWVLDMAFVNSGKSLLVSNNEGRLALWDSSNGSLISDVSLPLDPSYDIIPKIAVSRDRMFAAACGKYGKRLYVWNLQRSEIAWQSPQFSDSIESIQFIPGTDLILVVVGIWRKEYAILRLEDGHIVRRSVEENSTILCATTRSGQGIVVRNHESEGHVKFLDAVRETELCRTESIDDLCRGVFSKDGVLFAGLPDTDPAQIWNVDTGYLVARLVDGDNYFEQACFTEDNRGLLAMTCGAGHQLNSIGLWSLANSRLEKVFSVSEAPEKIVTQGQIFVSGGQGGTAEMFHIN